MLCPHTMSGQTVGVLGLGGSGMAAVAARDPWEARLLTTSDETVTPTCPCQCHVASPRELVGLLAHDAWLIDGDEGAAAEPQCRRLATIHTA